eukprot:479877-Amphidinium_carterae.2
MHPAHVTPGYEKAVQTLLAYHVPKTASRSYLADDSKSVRSVTFGGCTQRGVGITTITHQRSDILAAILQIAKSRPAAMRMPFLAATLTARISDVHTDANHGLSQTIAMGSLSPQSGALVINEKHFLNLNKWVQFDAREKH